MFFSTIGFFKTVLIGCVNQNENVFVYRRVCRENSETNDGTEGPGPTAGRLYEQKAFKIVVFERNVSFSTIVFFETVLFGCVNQNKNVFG
jgi:hypothetical protein